jgi:hypothetical protein
VSTSLPASLVIVLSYTAALSASPAFGSRRQTAASGCFAYPACQRCRSLAILLPAHTGSSLPHSASVATALAVEGHSSSKRRRLQVKARTQNKAWIQVDWLRHGRQQQQQVAARWLPN